MNLMNFKLLGLRDELVKATESLGFQSPMPIQQKAMPVLLSGEKDFVGLAQTGTGKTGAFGLPLIQLIDSNKSHTQGIVICPTRELCLQITDDLIQAGLLI
jgi:ATP-dependent RNA helicase DeaD